MTHVFAVQRIVVDHLEDFVKWPSERLLLWRGKVRKANFTYPPVILKELKDRGISTRTFSNDPAIASFLLARGERPRRGHKNQRWHIHHLYLGLKTAERRPGLHAVKDGNHFTQSAGLVAIHPIADALFEESPEFATLIREKSFHRFGYDPDYLFSTGQHDEFGFVPPHRTKVFYPQPNA